jgi:hypothetical protein
MKQADFTQQTDHPRPKFLAPAGIPFAGRVTVDGLYLKFGGVLGGTPRGPCDPVPFLKGGIRGLVIDDTSLAQE